jgi:hypothetical protein
MLLSSNFRMITDITAATKPVSFDHRSIEVLLVQIKTAYDRWLNDGSRVDASSRVDVLHESSYRGCSCFR